MTTEARRRGAGNGEARARETPSHAVRALAAALTAVAVLGMPPAAQAQQTGEEAGQDPAERLAALETRLSEARGALLPYLSPRSFQEAREQLEEARRRVDRGAAGTEVIERLQRAGAALDRAASTAEATRSLLAPALEARRRAVEARAASRSPEAWARAEERLVAAGRDAEEEDVEDATEVAAEAARRYDRAAVLALGLGPLADSLRSLEGSAEALLLRWDDVMDRLADTLAADPAGLSPDAPARLVPAVSRALDARRAVEDSLRSVIEGRDGRIAGLEGRIDSLERDLARSEVRGETLADALERRAERRRQVDVVRETFDDDEALVQTSGDTLTLRVVGLGFASGSAELDEEDTSLLGRIASAIRRFPEARLSIEGHTDSRGDARANRALSRERAVAVRDWLAERLSISPDRVPAEGFGESRPVASNDSAEGRALNRRIDVNIVLPSTG